jgi:hypothetical protein
MNASFRQRIIRRAHTRIAADDERTSGNTGFLILLIAFAALIAILLRMAEFALHRSPPAPPAAAVFTLK